MAVLHGRLEPAAGRSQNVTTDLTQTLAAAPVERATQGCAFAPRCPHALERYWNERPLYRTPGGVSARCFLHDVSGSRA